MATRPHFQRLVERVRLLPPLPAAFVYPCDRDSIQLALSGAFAGYLAPVLVGPEAGGAFGSGPDPSSACSVTCFVMTTMGLAPEKGGAPTDMW